ncbi:MAG: PSD1 and planctomycete cytochrome C domain-containing protein [Planctomycetota bacterium]
MDRSQSLAAVLCHYLPIICLTILLQMQTGVACGQNQIDFSRSIQPILSENCYFCHGQDENYREAYLRLDTPDAIRSVVVAEKPEESELYRRLITEDPDELMPPPDSHRKLTPQQIEAIRVWIESGANWEQHWAFRPIRSIEPQADSSIDYFVRQKLIAKGLDFSPEANKRTLIRRVSIDLTGLPPTPAELDAFLNDRSPDAYSKMVEHFLSSNAYGERMAWSWLDASRYADSNGYQKDDERTMWPWRDWVIDSFNQNRPFDEFSKWQLAGDLLPNATKEQKLATGFCRNHPINGEGGRIPEENRVDYVMDMTETMGTIWLGLTFNCCRCHDHKYDQLSQNDYYSMYAFFNQTPIDGRNKSGQGAPILPVMTQVQNQNWTNLNQAIATTQAAIERHSKKLSEQQPEWEKSFLEKDNPEMNWKVFEPDFYQAEHSQLKQLGDRSLLNYGPNPANDNYSISGKPGATTIQSIRLEVLPDPSMTLGGLARSNSGNFVLTDFEIEIKSNTDVTELQIANAIADIEQNHHKVSNSFDDNSKSGWAVLSNQKQIQSPRQAIFELRYPVVFSEDSELRIHLNHQSKHAHHNIGRFRISYTAQKITSSDPPNARLIEALRLGPEKRNKEQNKVVRDTFFATDAQFGKLNSQLKTLEEKKNRLDLSIPKVMIMKDRKPYRKTFRLNRGSYEEPDNEVFARIPDLFAKQWDDAGKDRLALANWLFAESNPLTSRVTVNRLWAQIFGVGLVKTTEDFGVQGEPPSHPKLLDYLSHEFKSSDWDTKHILRLILNSRTYRQSSQVNPQMLEIDPENRLLGRSPRYRMPSWMLRDYALAASGKLVRKIGGKPVNTYQPEGVWEEASFGKKKYRIGSGEDLYRRSIYTFWRRIAAPTMFFDNTDRMTCSVSRYLTNTPLHALNTLNDVTFVEAARILATDIITKQKTYEDRIDALFRRILSRPATAIEKSVLKSGLEATLQSFSANPEKAKQYIANGRSIAPSELDPIELASWSSLCLAVFNLDEALTRQ